ncbi:MAG: SRPBCC family protein [Rhizobiaceae bacterium]
MLWTILQLFFAAILLLLIYVWFKPNTFRLERSIVINAPSEKVYSHLADFRKWLDWSPWEGLDPDLKRSYSGPTEGVGATYAWEGNKKVGAGRMQLTKADPQTGISLTLDFFRPFKASNITDIAFSPDPDGGGTRVSWAMLGPQPFMGRLMTTFVSMDKMVGKDFEKGLAQLKAVSEN